MMSAISEKELFKIRKINIIDWSKALIVNHSPLYCQRQKICESLQRKIVELIDPISLEVEKKVLFRSASFSYGVFSLQLNMDARELFTWKRDNQVGSFGLYEFSRLTSTHAQRLYELLMYKQSLGETKVTVSIKRLRFMFNMENKAVSFREFRKGVLEIAQKQIEKFTPLRYQWQAISSSYRYEEIEFYDIKRIEGLSSKKDRRKQ